MNSLPLSPVVIFYETLQRKPLLTILRNTVGLNSYLGRPLRALQKLFLVYITQNSAGAENMIKNLMAGTGFFFPVSEPHTN